MPRRLRPLLAALAIAAVHAAPAGAAVTCDRYADPFGSDANTGTAAFPYRTAQKLADSLAAGQTGCLDSGTYSDEVTGPYVLRVNHGGGPGAPITIRSAPNQRATLRGIVYVPEHSDNVTISNLDIDGRRPTLDGSNGIQIMAADTIIEDNDITNHRNSICMILGSPGWGASVRTIVRRNVFHECGGTSNMLEHSIYVELTDSDLITDNLFLRTGAYAIHLYPDAHRTTVSHNVMVGGGGGVIFAGEGDAASSDNVVTQNIIVGSTRRPGIHSWWGGRQGTGNLAANNCMFDNPLSHVDVSGGGFAATGNVVANPGFVNAAADDYRLAPSSPCLGVVGYDTAARLAGAPAPSPQPTPTPTATATSTSTPAPTRTPAPTPSPQPTRTPDPTPSPKPTPAATPTPTPTPSATPAASTTTAPTIPPAQEGTAPSPDPDVPPVEAAHEIDAAAFSASCTTRRHRRGLC